MKFNMNTAWAQSLNLVRANFHILAIIAGLFLLIPSAVTTITMPDITPLMEMQDDPEKMAQAMADLFAPWLIYAIPCLFVQLIGYVAMISLMSEDRPTVGEAIVTGIKALPTLFGTLALFLIGYLVVSNLLNLAALLIGTVLGEAVGAVLAMMMAVFLLFGLVYVSVRLCLTIPVIVREKQLNPIKDFKRSWALTKSHAGPIMGFFALLWVAYFVISALVSGILTLILGAIGSVSAALLIGGLIAGAISAGLAMIISGILLSTYEQLSSDAA